MKTSTPTKPNIILINCDDLGWGDLGVYGHPRNKTPYLDTMASEGVRLTDFYMASPVCSPSRGAMMTGCYPKRIGFDQFDNGAAVLFPGHSTGLSGDEATIADLLKTQGYATALVGKWHCGDQPEFLPTRHGFDSYYGLPYSNDMGRQVGHRSTFPPLPLLLDEEVLELQPDQASVTERYVEQAIRFVREHRDGPFFLYFAHMYVHLPLYVQDRFLVESDNGVYGAAVAAIDWSVGVLMNELKRLGIDDETLVVFTSDNGSRDDFGDSNGVLRGQKGWTWEGGQRVPCIARWPGMIPAGEVCNVPAAAIDLLPTFAGLAGADVPTDRTIDGRDMLDLWVRPREADAPREAFYYYWKDALEAVRVGDWKLNVRKRDEHMESLFDLRHDPGETNDVAGDHPDVVRRLQAFLTRCRADLGDGATDTPGSDVRPIGRVAAPAPLATFDEHHPYYMAEYDIGDAG